MVDKGEHKIYSGHFYLWKLEELDITDIRKGIIEVFDKSKKGANVYIFAGREIG